MGRSARSRQLYASGPRAGPGHRTAGDGTQSVSVLLRSKKAPSGAPTGFQLPHPCFLPDALYTAQPPARSNDERGALLLDRSFQYALPLAFLRYRPDAGETGELRGLPIHKTSVHADVCSGCYQNSILVWLIIVRCVSSLGSSGVSRFEEFLDSERCRDDWESLS